MAGRVNTRFVIILASTLLLLCVGAAGFYYTFVRKSASEYEALGNRHLLLAENRQVEQGAAPEQAAEIQKQRGRDYRLAAENYGKAWQRDRTNVDVLLKYIEARRAMTVADHHEAQRVLHQVYRLMREATEQRRDDEALLENFYETIYRWARELHAPYFYTELATLTSNKLESYPDNLPALKFRAILDARQLGEKMDRAAQQSVKDDLERVLAERPGDTDVLHHLAQWYVFDANRLQQARGDAQQIAELRARALELARQTFEDNPNQGQVAVEYLDLLLMLADSYQKGLRYAGTEAERESLVASFNAMLGEARPVLDGLEAYLLGNPEPPLVVQRVAEMLPRLYREAAGGEAEGSDVSGGSGGSEGMERTQRLLRAAIEARPDMLLYKLMLANTLKLQVKLDEAHAVYLQARDQRVEGPAEASLRDESLRQQAVYEVANIELIRAEATDDPARREAILKDADLAVSDLERVTGEDARVLMLRGKIALLRGRNTEAMVAIDQASSLYQDREIEPLLLSARARQAEGQWGAAAQRLEQVLAMINASSRPEAYTSIRLQLAELLIRGRKFDQARAQIDGVLELEPVNATALRLRAQWFAAQERVPEAIAVLEGPELRGNARAQQALAQLYRTSGNEERGRSMLESQLEADPGNVRVLQQLLPLIESDEQKVALIDRAAASGASPTTIELLRLQASGRQRMTLEQVMERIDAAGGSELDVALRKSQIYQQAGQPEEARSFFEKARQLAPQDDRVVSMAMDYAIADRDFEAARRLVNDAARQNLDLANGHFLRGKLAAAEGDLAQARSSFDQGLKERPVFSEGWRQYGDLLLASRDPEAAAAAYRTALDQQPDNVRALLGMAGAEEMRGRPQAALERIREAVRYAPGDTALADRYLAYEERHGNPRVVLEARQEMARNQPENLDNRLSLAVLTAREGNVAAALAQLDALEAEQGRNVRMVATRATVLAAAERIEEGQAVLEGYLAERGDQATAEDHLMLARYRLSAGDTRGSLATYQQAIAVEDPSLRPASSELADVLFNFGQLDQALPIYQDLFGQASGERRTRLGQRLAEALLRDGQTDQAEAVLDQLEADATVDALRAMAARQRGDRDEALRLVNQSLGKDDSNAMTYLQRGELLAGEAATRDAALMDLDKALSLDANLVQALALRSDLLVAMGRESEAMRSLRTLLEQAPGNTAARYQLAQLHLRNNEVESARNLIESGLKLEPENPGWLQMSASLAMNRGDTAAATGYLETLVGVNPTPQAVGQLASQYLEAGRPTAAEALLDDHAGLLNESPALQGVRGRALAAQNKMDEAGRVYTLALERSRSAGQLNEVIGQVVRGLGVGPAIELIDAVTAEEGRALRDLALVRLSIEQKDYDGALERLSTLRETTPASETALRSQIDRLEALSRHASGDFAGARDAYRRLLETEPDNVEVLNNLAYLLANDLDDAEAAVPLAERAAENASSNAEVLDTLGWAYHRAGRHEDARRALEESVGLRPLPANTLHLGRVYLELRMPDQAREQLQRSIALAERADDADTAEDARVYLERLDN